MGGKHHKLDQNERWDHSQIEKRCKEVGLERRRTGVIRSSDILLIAGVNRRNIEEEGRINLEERKCRGNNLFSG